MIGCDKRFHSKYFPKGRPLHLWPLQLFVTMFRTTLSPTRSNKQHQLQDGVKDSNIKPPRNTTEVPIVVTEVESCTSKLVNQDELQKIEMDTTTIKAV